MAAQWCEARDAMELRRAGYFSTHPATGEPISWWIDCYLPYVRAFASRVHRANQSWLIALSPLPGEAFELADVSTLSVTPIAAH